MEAPIIVLASNNGDIGGGEVMLLNIAQAMTKLGMDVRIVGPREPSELVDAAKSGGFQTIVLDAATRRGYMFALRRWDAAHREGLLWCNGLVPAVATSGHPNRIVHLHQRPHGAQRPLSTLARQGALVTVVPSHNMAGALKGTQVLHNWVSGVPTGLPSDESRVASAIRLGFLGRPSIDKGVDVLAESLQLLDAKSPGSFRLVLAGESRFVDSQSQDQVAEALRSIEHLLESTGWIRPEEFFRQVDFLVCPSTWPESFGLVVAEAMSARVPFVISDAGALPEVAGAHHPWVFPAGNAAELASTLERAARADNTSNVENAFVRWEREFSPDAGEQRLGELLNAFTTLNIEPATATDFPKGKP
ncbi:glycosyltransferase involved in cell wall biosynthesis [Arthrobacter sp. UYEF6]